MPDVDPRLAAMLAIADREGLDAANQLFGVLATFRGDLQDITAASMRDAILDARLLPADDQYRLVLERAGARVAAEIPTSGLAHVLDERIPPNKVLDRFGRRAAATWPAVAGVMTSFGLDAFGSCGLTPDDAGRVETILLGAGRLHDTRAARVWQHLTLEGLVERRGGSGWGHLLATAGVDELPAPRKDAVYRSAVRGIVEARDGRPLAWLVERALAGRQLTGVYGAVGHLYQVAFMEQSAGGSRSARPALLEPLEVDGPRARTALRDGGTAAQLGATIKALWTSARGADLVLPGLEEVAVLGHDPERPIPFLVAPEAFSSDPALPPLSRPPAFAKAVVAMLKALGEDQPRVWVEFDRAGQELERTIMVRDLKVEIRVMRGPLFHAPSGATLRVTHEIAVSAGQDRRVLAEVVQFTAPGLVERTAVVFGPDRLTVQGLEDLHAALDARMSAHIDACMSALRGDIRRWSTASGAAGLVFGRKSEWERVASACRVAAQAALRRLRRDDAGDPVIPSPESVRG